MSYFLWSFPVSPGHLSRLNPACSLKSLVSSGGLLESTKFLCAKLGYRCMVKWNKHKLVGYTNIIQLKGSGNKWYKESELVRWTSTQRRNAKAVSLLVPVLMAVLACLFLHPLLSAASFAHQEHHESVQSEGPYHQKWQGLAGRSRESDAIFPQLAASGWLGGTGFRPSDGLALRIWAADPPALQLP